eukprot:TRINITY_DN43379_c0_g1_i1.p1 TRINITY_DN43379_c0_g1~~TRINITY_DN43379_c0_g1_i1.p1  ORF type:complete len:459 (+),score=99.91 TRINITY_DN43379_c0_g1_i1:57-1433(+)
MAKLSLLLLCAGGVRAYTPPDACSDAGPAEYVGNTRTYGFGVNWYGSLGFDKNRTTTPKLSYIGSDLAVQLRKMSGGFMHTAALLRNHQLYVTGDGTEGQLGLGNSVLGPYKRFSAVWEVLEKGDPMPSLIRPPGSNRGVIDVCAGWSHTCAILADEPDGATSGRLYCTGSHEYGQLGIADRIPRKTGRKPKLSALAPVETSSGSLVDNAVGVACGADHTIVVDAAGAVWAFGRGGDGQLGNGAQDNSDVVTRVLGLPAGVGVRQLAAGIRSSYALLTDGTLWGWGLNKRAQLGVGGNGDRSGTPDRLLTPMQIAHPEGLRFDVISAGGYHVVGIDRELKALAWGSATLGQTGIDAAPQQKREWVVPTPTRIPALANVNIAQVCAGYKHTLFLTTCGQVLAAGSDVFSQLGNGPPQEDKMFKEMQPVQNSRFRQWGMQGRRIDCGSYFSFITSDDLQP